MSSQAIKTNNPGVSFIVNERDLLIVVFAFVFSVLGYTVNMDFNVVGVPLSFSGLVNALLPSKKDPQDERTTYIKYITGFYAFSACMVGLFTVLLVVRFLHVSIVSERLPFYFLHASLFIYTLLYAVIRRIR